jgi:hypothetical protein
MKSIFANTLALSDNTAAYTGFIKISTLDYTPSPLIRRMTWG